MQILFTSILAGWFLLSPLVQTPAPTMPAEEPKYQREAIVVLTPELCTTVATIKGNFMYKTQKYKAGELICPAAEAAVKKTFEKSSRVAAPTKTESSSGQIVLTPKFVSLDVTKTATAMGLRKMVVLVEWTATNESGKVFWIQTVEASTEEKTGNTFTGKEHEKKMLESIETDLIDKFTQAIRSSVELQKVAGKDH